MAKWSILVAITRICILLRLPTNLLWEFLYKNPAQNDWRNVILHSLFALLVLFLWFCICQDRLKKRPRASCQSWWCFYLQTPWLLFNFSQKIVYTLPFSISLCKSQSRQSFVTWLSATTFPIQFPFINIYCCSFLAFSQQNIVLQRDWKCHKRQRKHYEVQNVSEFPSKILYCT